MRHLTIHPSSINERHIAQAAQALERGELLLMPTDTLYALACSALDNRACERLCRAAGIDPQRRPLSAVCADIAQASRYARIDNRAFDIIKANTPGPYTFILPAMGTLPRVFKGRRTVGIRIPDCAVARALAQALDAPVAVASAAVPDGAEEVTTRMLEDAYSALADLAIDAGPRGTEGSTIIDLTDSSDPRILRKGAGIY